MIIDFLSSFKESLAKPSRFKVVFTPKKNTTLLNRIINPEKLSFRCDSTSLPGRNIATGDMRIYGPTEKFPYQSMYDDITMTFICTDSMVEKTFFDQWMEVINPQDNWNFDYKENYSMNISIEQFDNIGNISHAITLIDAFPVSMNDMPLDWSNGDSFHKVSVTFAYTYWKRKETLSNDQQIINEIPSLLTSTPDSLAQRQGTYLSVTNQSIGPFDTLKDQEASRINKKNQTNNIVPSHLRS